MINHLVNRLLLFWLGIALLNSIQQDYLARADGSETSIPFSKISDLMSTPRHEAAKRKPVRVRGMVSLLGDGITSLPTDIKASRSFCIEDSSAGIWVRSGQAIRDGVLLDSDNVLPELDYGIEIELAGYLDKGGFAPVILPTKISIVGKGKLPDAMRTVASRFLNGADELRRVTISGVVQNISGESPRFWSLRVETGVGHFLTRLPKEDSFTPDRLLDANIEVTGVAAVCWNWRSEFVCPRLIIAHRDDVQVLQPATDPFAAKLVSLRDLDSYSPSGRPRHRRRIQGTVTYYDRDTLLYVQDHGIGIQVRLNEPMTLDVGDQVEVSGFIDTSRYLAGLRGAVARRLGRREAPVAIPLPINQVLEEHQGTWTGQPATLKSCDGRLIQIYGRLLNYQVGLPPKPSRLEIDCGDSVATAFLSGPASDLRPGTELKISGIAKLVFSPPVATSSLARPDHVDLLLRDADDIQIISSPSWWTLHRTLNALVVVAGLALAACVWAFTLRRTLAQKSKQLAHEMRDRRDAAIEFQGAIHERTRLAANLHDTLLQTLTGLAYQIDACGQPETKSFRGHLETASRMIQHGQEDLRNTVWALHCLPLNEKYFVDSVRHVTAKFGRGNDTTINVRCDDDFPVLADFIAGNLLLVIQESVHNAIKHAQAERIDIELRAQANKHRVSVAVRDDGIGFEIKNRKTSSDGHFGLEGMERRVERLGGTLEIESHRGNGTYIHASIPLREFDPQIA